MRSSSVSQWRERLEGLAPDLEAAELGPARDQLQQLQKTLAKLDQQALDPEPIEMMAVIWANFQQAINKARGARNHRSAQETRKESRRFEQKFALLRQVQAVKEDIERLEAQKQSLNQGTEARRFEEKFRILQQIQAKKEAIGKLEAEKAEIAAKGNTASPAELARNLDLAASIYQLNQAVAEHEEGLNSLDARIKSDKTQQRLRIIGRIRKLQTEEQALQERIKALDKDASASARAAAKQRKDLREAIASILAPNQKLIDWLSSAPAPSHAGPPPTKASYRLGPKVQALAETLIQLGEPGGAEAISELAERFARFQETLAERINPEISAFDRYMLRALDLKGAILNELKRTAGYLRALGADQEPRLSRRLLLLEAKAEKRPQEYDEIFEKRPALHRIQEGRAKARKRIARVKKAIALLGEETVAIALRKGYRVSPPEARSRLKGLARSKRESVSLEAAMEKFQADCALNKRILDRFEQHSLQHQRYQEG